MASTERPPPPTHILETILYVKDKEKSHAFYRDILGLTGTTFPDNPRGVNFSFGNQTLILFQLGLTNEDMHAKDAPEKFIPKHGPTKAIVDQLVGDAGKGSGSTESLGMHFCLAVPTRAEVLRWEQYLKSQDVKVISVYDWDLGGRSVYFEDPDGNVGEIGSRGIWPFY